MSSKRNRGPALDLALAGLLVIRSETLFATAPPPRIGSDASRRLAMTRFRSDNRAMIPTSISPMLSVRRGAAAVEFYKSAFGADVVYRIDAPDGTVVARLSINGAEFWVADESPEHKNFSPETLGGGTVRMVMVVDDPDAAFAKAAAAGAVTVWPVGNQHGWRLGRVVDPYGHHWEIGKPIS